LQTVDRQPVFFCDSQGHCLRWGVCGNTADEFWPEDQSLDAGTTINTHKHAGGIKGCEGVTVYWTPKLKIDSIPQPFFWASVDSLGIEGKQGQTCEHQYNKSCETDMDVCFCGHAMNPFRSSLGPPPFVSIS